MDIWNMFKQNSKLLRNILSGFVLLIITSGVFLLSFINAAQADTTPTMQLQNGVDQPYPAPELQGITGWFNSPPLTLQSLKGKVVLLDFWTYGCPYCVYSMPHLNDWYNKYNAQGLVIIGVHSPEYLFEEKLQNIQDAINKYGIQYPIAVDNTSQSWKEYNGQYWPTTYLIDKNGNVVYQHLGQGGYEVTENNIRILLSEPENQ